MRSTADVNEAPQVAEPSEVIDSSEAAEAPEVAEKANVAKNAAVGETPELGKAPAVPKAPEPENNSAPENTPAPAEVPNGHDAPPQPPLPSPLDEPVPPVVHGIDDSTPEIVENGVEHVGDTADANVDDSFQVVRANDLAAFIELYVRFQTRIERLGAGRRLTPLREAWEAAAAEMKRFPNRVDLILISEKVIHGLRLGCESGRVLIVDACLDCIHRLFEYGHIGSTGEDTDIILDKRQGALDEIVSLVCGCLEVKEEEVYLRMVQTLLTAATRTKSGLHHGTLLAAVRTVYNIYLNAREPGVRTTARVCITQILSLVFARMEAESADSISNGDINEKKRVSVIDAQIRAAASDPTKPAGNGVNIPRPEPPAEEGGDASVDFATVLQKDSYLLFRALCKISAKDVPDGASPESVGLRSKLLSLELLRTLVNDSGPCFRTGERFIYALRQYMAPSLLANSMSSAMSVVDVSLDIFELLLRKETLRPLLKTEIGTVFQTVIFRFLESPTAGPERHRKALGLLHRLADDHQTLADLFLNYDCDVDSPNIFERCVSALSSAAEKKVDGDGNSTPAPGSLAGESDIRGTALASLVLIVKSLRNWSKPIEDERAATLNGSSELDLGSSGDLLDEGETGDTDDATPSKINGVKSIDTRAHSQEGLPNSNSFLGRVSEGSDRDTSRFETGLRLKRVLAEGIAKFNMKPKSGIEHLVSKGRLARDPKAVAEFLLRAESLDATMIGEYLGDSDPFAISVMHAYTDMKDFKGLPFDSALRAHLAGFRLPGESQKIDRVMEKFASRFCACNPGIFATADAAYVLAYSVIMLHTDAHNATIKNKMSKEEFIRNNRGINDGGDLDPDLLSGLYERITTTEIQLSGNLKDSAKDSVAAAAGSAANPMSSMGVDPYQRAKEFKEESERLLAQSRVLFANRRKTPEDYTYYSATNLYHARLMFEVACFPMLAAFSLLLEEASPTDSAVVSLCLDGFRNGIAIASTFSMSTAKDAFVSSLTKFTHLNSISEMRAKNVECVRMILAIAALEGNNLGEQWLVIVRAISQLEQIRAISSGNPGKYLLQKNPAQENQGKNRLSESQPLPRTVSGKSGKSTGGGAPTSLRRVASASAASSKRMSAPGSSTSSLSEVPFSNVIVDPKAASLASTISESEIERIFTNSSLLSPQGVVDFCGALCAISLEELGEAVGPRLFCMQKVVELAYYNMESRTRLQWGKIWDKMGPFFAAAMCHENPDVAMYAVDALRQLASKFLDKDELSNFSFQRAFLKPFEVCFGKSKNMATRELVLTCISQIVLARAANIKSGWKSVFSVLALSADDNSELILNFGFEIAQSILDKYLAVYEDLFVDAVNGITAFTRAAKSSSISMAAINLLCYKCAPTLSNGKAVAGSESNDVVENGTSEVVFNADTEAHIGAWFPLLTGLAAAIQDDREAVQLAARDGLFMVLEEYGGRFSPGFWLLVFRGVLSPLFDDVRYLSHSSDKLEASAISEWASTMGASSLRSLVDVFVSHIEVTRGLLHDLLELLRAWVAQESEIVAREGMGALARLIMMSGDLLVNNDWQTVVDAVKYLFEDTMPHEIIGPKGLTSGGDSDEEMNGLDDATDKSMTAVSNSDAMSEENEIAPFSESGEDEKSEKMATIDFRVVRSKCVVQLLLIQLVQDAVVSFYLKLSTAHIQELGEAVRESYSFAQKFNANVELRYSLWRAGFMNQVPNLLKQETCGLTTYLRIMFWLYLDPSRTDCDAEFEANVVQLCDRVLKRYISNCEKSDSKAEDRREVAAVTPVVILIINGMMQMSTEQFEKHLGNLYDILLQLIEGADERKVRREVCRLLRARIGPHLRGLFGKKSRSVAALPEEIEPVHPEKVEGNYVEYIAKPQIPGPLRERVLAVEGEDNADGVELNVQNALSKLSGVRSATVNMEQGIARVTSSTPDDLLVSTVENVSKVRSVFLVQSSDSPLLVG